MGEIIYIVNLDKKEYISKANKMREWELNPEESSLLFLMMDYYWSGDRIKLVGSSNIDSYPNMTDVTERALTIQKEID